MEEMNVTPATNVAEPTVEQLKAAYTRVVNENAYLKNVNNELCAINAYKRLDYLFKVIENSIEFSDEFVSKCISEIEDTMTIKQEETDKPVTNE